MDGAPTMPTMPWMAANYLKTLPYVEAIASVCGPELRRILTLIAVTRSRP